MNNRKSALCIFKHITIMYYKTHESDKQISNPKVYSDNLLCNFTYMVVGVEVWPMISRPHLCLSSFLVRRVIWSERYEVIHNILPFLSKLVASGTVIIKGILRKCTAGM